RKTPMPPVAAAFIIREVCRALAHAHAHLDENGGPSPIIHRDVSPTNVVVGYDGQVKLVDFGVAKALHADHTHTRDGIIKRKLGCTAPVQMDGLAVPQSDLFAAGIVLYEMLTLRRLIKGASSFETMTKLRSMAFPAPSKVSAAIPPALDSIVLRSLQRDLDLRYASAGSMAKDLDLVVQAGGVSVEGLGHLIAEGDPGGFHTEPSPA